MSKDHLSPPRYSRRRIRRAVRAYSRSQGWLTHRLMIEQHVEACLRDPHGLCQKAIDHYFNISASRQLVTKRFAYAVILCLVIVIAVRYWLL